jgi:IS5 family transposase
VDTIEPIKGPRGRPGRPRKRPKKLHAGKGYDFPRCRNALRKRGIKARISRRGIDSSERLGHKLPAIRRPPRIATAPEPENEALPYP